MSKPEFWKSFPSGQEGSKNPKNGPKLRPFGFWQKSNPFICTFLFEYESANGFLRRAQKVIKMAQKLGLLGFDKNLIHSYVLFLLEYESANGFLQKPHVWEKSCPWVMVQEPLDQSECRIFKLRYLTNHLSYEVEFLHVIRHS